MIPRRRSRWRGELGDTHKPEAIAQSNICFRSFLPSLTLWLSPNVLTPQVLPTKCFPGEMASGLWVLPSAPQ